MTKTIIFWVLYLYIVPTEEEIVKKEKVEEFVSLNDCIRFLEENKISPGLRERILYRLSDRNGAYGFYDCQVEAVKIESEN